MGSSEELAGKYVSPGKFSQQEEETAIQEALILVYGPSRTPEGRTPRFLDIGAHDGEMFSNSRRLALNGWNGMCVEPSAGPLRKLADLYRDSRAVKVVGALVVPTAGFDRHAPWLVRFSMSNDGVSSTSFAHRQKWEGYITDFADVFVPAVPLNEVLALCPSPTDLLSIDAEGGSVDLLLDYPVDAMKTKIVVVEFDDRKPEVLAWAKVHNFHIYYENDENLVLFRR